LGIMPIVQPESLKEPLFIQALEELQPDIIVVVAFRIVPRSVYTLARLGAFNVHASLLPKYRGAAPINWAIINGEKETGVTSFLLADAVDTGAILAQRRVPIADAMTAGELHDVLMPVAADLAVETCSMLISGNAYPLPQDDSLATPAPKIFRETCRIDWSKPTYVVRNHIHGVSPHPGAWTILPDGKLLKVIRCRIHQSCEQGLRAGEYCITDYAWLAGCSDGVLELVEIHLEGKRRMLSHEYIRGVRGARSGQFRSVAM
ncbi:MAG: methionyl-tRNA formyltransferase, partial [Bacteroidota bacterium]|nr:methionyl-tRNA formyltransferase [Candidatus Kapabacteria bacterium]MDW8221062.1 methionyl-tRNA formyltransferase [Bacteroidota bacterium]